MKQQTIKHEIVKETITYHSGTKEVSYYVRRFDGNEWNRISPKFLDLDACKKAVDQYIDPDIEIKVIEKIEK